MDQITILEALFLGLVQGFTEWLPISSSGHLVIFESLLGISVPADFNIVIMMGTIAALILYFRKKIFLLLRGIAAFDRPALTYWRGKVIERREVPHTSANIHGSVRTRERFFAEQGAFVTPRSTII
jgi:hypothetical protein